MRINWCDGSHCVFVCVARSWMSSVCTQYIPNCVANAAYSIRTEYQSHFIQSCVLSSTSSNYEIILLVHSSRSSLGF